MTILVPELGFSAGTETVLLRVLPRWADAGHAVVLGAPSYRLKHYAKRGLDARVQRVVAGWEDRGWRAWARRLEERSDWRWLRAMGLRDQARRLGASHVFVPWMVDQPAVDFGLPTGVMLMDLAWRHYPAGWFGKPAAALDAGLETWLRQADVVFPVSEATADEARAAFPSGAARLVTVPHGAAWRGRGPAGKQTCADELPYFLTPASLTPNKAHATLLRAAIGLWRRGGEFRLVWTGSGTDAPENAGELGSLLREHAGVIAGRWEGRGFVSDEELDRLYAGAQRVVLPSTYEGFGLPVMEAFERGARVICTDIAPFEEQVKRHGMESRATRVPAGDEAALAAALAAALQAACEGDERHDVASEAELRKRVEAWTWDDAARAYAQTLETGATATVVARGLCRNDT